MIKFLDQENKNQDGQMRPNFEIKRIELDEQLNVRYEVEGKVKENFKLSYLDIYISGVQVGDLKGHVCIHEK